MSTPERPPARPLTPRQCVFVNEYLVDLNARQAAIRAGYPPASAANRGWELLHTCAPVKARIAEAMAERERRTQIEADRVLREIARIAFSDMRRYLKSGPKGAVVMRPLGELDDDDAAAVAELRGGGAAGGPRGIKLHDKQAALELLARHLGLVGRQVSSRPAPRPPYRPGEAREILRRRLALLGERDDSGDAPAAPAATA